MSSSIFRNPTPNKLNQLMQMAKSIQQNNPEAMFQQMYASNPQFKQFVDENRGMSLEDIARKYGMPI